MMLIFLLYFGMCHQIIGTFHHVQYEGLLVCKKKVERTTEQNNNTREFKNVLHQLGTLFKFTVLF